MLIEAKRFLGLEQPPLPELIKMEGKLAIIDIERIQDSSINGISAAIRYAEVSRQFFEHTDKIVKLTKTPPWALVEDHIQYGRREVLNEHNQLVFKATFWRIEGRHISELPSDTISNQKYQNKAIRDLEKQNARQVAKKFITTIHAAIK